MSMQTDCIYGYGFAVYASDDELRRFITSHRDTVKQITDGEKVLQYLDSHEGDSFNPKEDLYDYETAATGDMGFYGVIAEIMSNETGIVFEFRNSQEDDGNDYILFPESYPWHYNERESKLTLDELKDICIKYITELNPNLVPGFQRLEYFG